MRIIFDRSTVIAAVTPLMCAVSNKNTLPAIEGILMRTVPGGIEMTTFDLEKGVRLFCAAEVLEEGYIILNAQKFFATIRATAADADARWYGVNFEQTLPYLMSRLGKFTRKENAL